MVKKNSPAKTVFAFGNLLKFLFLLFFIVETLKVLLSYYSNNFIEYGFHFILIWMVFVPAFFLFAIFETWYLRQHIDSNLAVLLIPLIIPLTLAVSFLIRDQIVFLWSISIILIITTMFEIVMMIYHQIKLSDSR